MYDKDSVLHIFCWLHNVSPNCAIPPECRVKIVLEKVLDERLKNSGNRQRLVPADFLLPNGAVNWVPLLYLVGFSAAEGQRLSSITHTPTGAQVVIDEHIGIDSSFELVHGWSDGNAELQKGVTRKFKLCTFFSNKYGPYSSPQWTGKCRNFQTHAAAVAEAERARTVTTESATSEVSEVFNAVDRCARTKAAAKARQALEERKVEYNKKRRISLSASPSPPAARDQHLPEISFGAAHGQDATVDAKQSAVLPGAGGAAQAAAPAADVHSE